MLDAEKPGQMSVRPWDSPTHQETLAEIAKGKIKPTRSLLRMQFIKKRKDFNQPTKFTQTDSEKNAAFQVFKDDNLGLRQTKVMEIGLQGSEPYASTGAQTSFRRKIRKCLQIEESSLSLEPIAKPKDDQLMRFLDNVYQEMQEALQSNETIDIFQNDFDVLKQKEGGGKESAEISNAIKQTKNLFYLRSKGKKVSCIQFQPWLPSRRSAPIIAQSFVQNLSFDERAIFSLKSSKSFILFWNYQDMHAIDPLLILESPLQILNFEFNPTDPNILIAGAVNGQILMWDLKNHQIGQINKKKLGKPQKNQIEEIKPAIMSALQDPANITPVTDQIKRNVPSHKAPITCIKWFPSGLEIQMKKSYIAVPPQPGHELYQFASISTDGQVLLWERKFLDAQKKPLSQFSWKAGFGFHLFRPEGGGAMGGSLIAFNKNQTRTVFTGSSDQGDLFVCDWSNRSMDEAGSKNDSIISYWGQERSYRPTVALDLQPSNEDIILTVYDFHFCIWKKSVESPIFTSTVSKGSFNTCGCWSPSRAGVLFIGKSNGTIDIWDFMDQSHKYTMQYSVGSVGISSIKFHQSAPSTLAVGSQEGSLHILELPFTLVRKVGSEDKTISQFWQREIESVAYFQKRFKARYEQSQKELAQRDLEEKMKMQKEEKKEKKEDELAMINKDYEEFAQAYVDEHIYRKKDKENK